MSNPGRQHRQLDRLTTTGARVRVLLLATLTVAASCPARGAEILFSTEYPESVAGPDGSTTAFADDDVVRYDLDTAVGVIERTGPDINPDPGPTAGLPDTNALFARRNGNLVFSIQSGSARLSGDFNDDDLIEYDRSSGTLSTLFSFDEVMTSVRGRDIDIDGFHLLDDGRFLIANRSDFALGGMAFRNGDIALYDPSSDSASLFFDERLFGGVDARITGLSLTDTGTLVIAAFNEDTGLELTLGGQTFGRGDLVEYDASTGSASLFFPSSNFRSGTADFDAVHFVLHDGGTELPPEPTGQ